MGLSKRMAKLKIKSKAGYLWDLVSPGEVMLRLDPGDGRIPQRVTFAYGRAEAKYNVARGLRRCFDMDTAIVTALAENAQGRDGRRLIDRGNTVCMPWARH
jgi:2-dehydro-3-deoxygluconokinase